MNGLFEGFLATPDVTDALGDRAVVQAMLHFEAALARAQASAGLIDSALAQSIIGTCQIELFDVPKLARESARIRSLATPLVSHLRETVALFNPQAAHFVHMGCSDTDLVDTTLALVSRDALKLIQTDLAQTIASLLTLADQHAGDAMLARSNLHSPCLSSFGLTLCQWSAPLVRSQQRLLALVPAALCLRLGSSMANFAQLNGKAQVVANSMAADLQLKAPDYSGQVGYDERTALACELGLLTSNLGKISADMAYLARPEINEINPISSATGLAPGAKPNMTTALSTLCMLAQSATQRVPPQVTTLLANLAQGNLQLPGHWQAELTQWPALLSSSHLISRSVAQMVSSVQANPERMCINLDTMRSTLIPKEAKSYFGSELLSQAKALTHIHLNALKAQQN